MTGYDTWILKQQEPILFEGLYSRYKREKPLPPIHLQAPDKFDRMTEAEKDAANDEYLRRYGL